jgi:hypothetical protein
MTYRVVEGVKLTQGDVSVTGPCDLPFGTPEEIAFWVTCGAVEVVAAPVVVDVRKGVQRGRS